MRVVIAGSRSIDDYALVLKGIERSGFDITEVVSGKAVGVDTLGEVWAKAHGVPVIERRAQWNVYGKRAGRIRNAQMADIAEAAVVVWDGISPGSKNMIDEMNKRDKPVYIQMSLDVRNLDDFYYGDNDE